MIKINKSIEKNLEKILLSLNKGEEIIFGSENYKIMSYYSRKAIELTMKINTKYNNNEEIIKIMSELTGNIIDKSFVLFPPFYTDFGKNIKIGKNVFINSGCKFQDQGGIEIGESTFIGHNVVIATLNHNLKLEKRNNLIPKFVKIGKNVWIGSNSTICPGVIIGDGCIIAAGSVVTKSFEKNVMIAGVPAKIIKKI